MKTKTTSLFEIDLGKPLEFAEKGLESLMVGSEKKLERLLGGKPKNKRQAYLDRREKERKEQLKITAVEQDSYLETINSIAEPDTTKMEDRLSELENKSQETDVSLDTETAAEPER